MRTPKIQSILLIVSVFALTACGKVSSTPVTYTYGGLQQNPNTATVASAKTPLQAGTWSNNGVILTVTSNGASLQLSCGSGSLNAPLSLDADNSFQVSGTYSSGVRSEIVSEDGTVTNTQNKAVVYSGFYDSNSEVLSVIMSDASTGQTLNTYSLTYGTPSAPLFTCY